MPYKCDRDCFNKNEDGWCKDEWCRNPVPSVPYGAVYRHTDYAEEVYDKQTNADRIRSMTDEELARFIAGQRGWFCDFKDPTDEEYPKVLDWLKQECKT